MEESKVKHQQWILKNFKRIARKSIFHLCSQMIPVNSLLLCYTQSVSVFLRFLSGSGLTLAVAGGLQTWSHVTWSLNISSGDTLLLKKQESKEQQPGRRPDETGRVLFLWGYQGSVLTLTGVITKCRCRRHWSPFIAAIQCCASASWKPTTITHNRPGFSPCDAIPVKWPLWCFLEWKQLQLWCNIWPQLALWCLRLSGWICLFCVKHHQTPVLTRAWTLPSDMPGFVD